MLLYRVVSGAIAAALTAAVWSRMPRSHDFGACAEPHSFWRSFVDLGGNGVGSFAIAAGISTVFLAFFARSVHAMGPVAAGVVGALLSPCSSADALLARVLFREPGTQLVFIIAAQCLDIRQISLLYKSFGATYAAGAFGAALVACFVGHALALR